MLLWYLLLPVREAETCFHTHSVGLCLFMGVLISLMLRDINDQLLLFPPILLFICCVCSHKQCQLWISLGDKTKSQAWSVSLQLRIPGKNSEVFL